MSPDVPRPTVKLLIPQARIARRVEELAEQLTSDYARRPEPPVFVGVLKGAAVFLADLVRAAAAIELATDFMSISAYGGSEGRSGVVQIVKDLDLDVFGRDVVLVEDIVDTGLTLNYLRSTLAQREPASLRTVTLLDKAARRIVPVAVEYVGFEVPDVFVVGYGLDFRGRYRNLCDIVAVRDPEELDDGAVGLERRHLKPDVRC